MALKKGDPKVPGSGRKKGSANKMPCEARAYVLATAKRLEEEGHGLYAWAKENPGWFWNGVYKVIIPKEMKIDANVNMTHEDLLKDIE